jgi:hypothetical protein
MVTILVLVYFGAFFYVGFKEGQRNIRKKIKRDNGFVECPHCNGSGYEGYDTNGDPLDICEYCGSMGKLLKGGQT